MQLISKVQTPIILLFVNKNIKCGWAFSWLEHEEHFGTKFDFAISAPLASVSEEMDVTYVT